MKTLTRSTLGTLAVLLGIGLPSAALAQTHVDNPFVGATVYKNPDYTAKVQTSIAQTTDAALKSKMQIVAQTPTFIWLDRIAAIAGGPDATGLQQHLDNALAQRTGTTPIVAEFVVYDLPGRDCAALASNGEIPLTADGLNTYKTQYIDEIARIMGMAKYSSIRIVTVVEPDSLPNLVTNLSDPECSQASSTNIYAQGVQYALNKLHAIPNVYTYLDIGHSGWLGWPNNASGAVSLFTTIVNGTTARLASVDGFVTNTANDTSLKEPFMTGSQTVNNQPVSNANFYQSNPDIDEIAFTADLYARFTAPGAGWPTNIGFLIDTSRNGWGGPGRPTAASSSTDLNTFVNQTKIDPRQHRGLWCNQNGAGLGERPQASPPGFPASHLDAFVWVKPPGDSDGSSSLIPNDEGKGFDRFCDPTFTTPDGTLTNALPNAPISGHWFHTQFVQLVQNAFPPVGGGPPPPVCAAAPAAPTSLTATATSSSQINLSWSAVTPPANCSVTYTVHRSTTNGFTPSATTLIASGLTTTSLSDTGRAASTQYFYAVQAVDAAGNSAFTRANATTPPGGGGGPGTCHVGYTVTNSWNTGFQVALSIQNTGTAALTGWTLTWTFPNTASSIASLWNGAATQTGAAVTVNNLSYNGTIAAGASYNDAGFVGNGPASVPTSFSINGVVCN